MRWAGSVATAALRSASQASGVSGSAAIPRGLALPAQLSLGGVRLVSISRSPWKNKPSQRRPDPGRKLAATGAVRGPAPAAANLLAESQGAVALPTDRRIARASDTYARGAAKPDAAELAWVRNPPAKPSPPPGLTGTIKQCTDVGGLQSVLEKDASNFLASHVVVA